MESRDSLDGSFQSLLVDFYMLHVYISSTGPYTDSAVPPAFDQVPVSYTYTLHDSWRLAVLGRRDASAAVPLPSFHLIVHLYHVLGRRADDAPCVKHHACHRVVVCVCVVDRSCSEVPDLELG